MDSPTTDPTPAAPIRVATFGGRGTLCQQDRIDAGFAALGTTVLPQGAPQGAVDLVYSNDEPRWQEAIDYRDRFVPEGKLILTVLDLPEHATSFEPSTLLPRLLKADAITAISPFVVSQVQRVYGLNADLIWQPIKPITPAERRAGKKSYPFRILMAGRLRDPGKRAELAIRSLIRAGFNENEVAVVGGEWPSWGTDLGIVTDEVLNSLYNSVDFVMMVSSFEGMGLPAFEGMAGGALPILTHDLTTIHDMGVPQRWGCHPSTYSIAHRLITLCNNRALFNEERAIAEQIGQQMIQELSGTAVARRILSVYSNLIPIDHD